MRKVINSSKELIPANEKWKHINLNPFTPSIKGLIKLHKPEHPIRPVVNWSGAPCLQIGPDIHKKDQINSPAPPHIHHRQHQRANHQTNSPSVLPSLARHFQPIHQYPGERNQRYHRQHPNEKRSGPPNQQELVHWYDTITHQNYFSSSGKILIQQDGLAMGAPSSGLIAEFSFKS